MKASLSSQLATLFNLPVADVEAYTKPAPHRQLPSVPERIEVIFTVRRVEGGKPYGLPFRYVHLYTGTNESAAVLEAELAVGRAGLQVWSRLQVAKVNGAAKAIGPVWDCGHAE